MIFKKVAYVSQYKNNKIFIYERIVVKGSKYNRDV